MTDSKKSKNNELDRIASRIATLQTDLEKNRNELDLQFSIIE